LFSTAADLAMYAQMIVNRGSFAGVRILSPRTVDLMTEAVAVPSAFALWAGTCRRAFQSIAAN